MPQVPVYRSQHADSIAALLARQGDISAEGSLRSGAIWGNTVGQLGQIAGDAVAQHQAQKTEAKRADQFNAALASWDPKDPGKLYRGVAVAYGPEMAKSALGAMLSIEESKKLEAPDPKLFQAKADFLWRIWKENPGWVKENWQGIAQAVGPDVEALYKMKVPPQWDDAMGGILDSLAPQGRPEGALVTTVGPDGKPVQRRASEAELASPGGVPVYEKPVDPKAQSLDEMYAAAFQAGDTETMAKILKADSAKAAATRAPREPDKPKELKPLLLGEVRAVQEFRAGLNAFDSISKDVAETGAGSKAAALIPGAITQFTGWGADSKSRQSALEAARQTIGKAMEGGVLRKEDELKYNRMLPIISDPPEVAKGKLTRLKQRMLDDAESYLEVLEASGRDVSQIRGLVFGGEKFAGDGGPGPADVDALLKKHGF